MSSGYYRFPTIQAETVVFACEDDLWTVPVAGGVARRLTANLGEVSLPRLSPDGKRLVFVGREEGSPEIYCMPAGGGPSQRLTYQAASICKPLAWLPDGRILLVSNAGQPIDQFTLAYLLNPETLGLERLPYGPVRDVTYGPDGQIVIGRNTADPARWKRYRGGTAGQIWIATSAVSPATQAQPAEFNPLINLPGNLAAPMWIGERIYFLSDHEGFGNIYSCFPDGSSLRRHTDHADFYARNPSSDGRRIVYHAGADLYCYDPDQDETRRIEVTIQSPRVQRSRKFVSAGRYLGDWALHPQGQSLAVTSRGRLFAFANWEGPALTLGETEHNGPDGNPTTVRYRLPGWLPDGKRLLAISDADGEEAFVILDETGVLDRLAGVDIGRPLAVAVNPRKDQVLFSNHRYELCVLDLNSREIKVVDRGVSSPIGGFAWSPDGEWAAYSVSISNQVMVLKLWQSANGQITQLTQPVLADYAPSFDPGGKYLYFISKRTFDPVYDSLQFDLSFPRGLRPYLITLQRDIPNPFIPQPRQPEPEKSHTADSASGDGAPAPAAGNQVTAQEKSTGAADTEPGDKEKETFKPLPIHLEGIQDRVVAFPVPEGLYGRVQGIQGGKVLYTRFPIEGSLDLSWSDVTPPNKATLFTMSFEDCEEEVLVSNLSDFYVTSNGATLAYRSGGNLRVLRTGEKPRNGDDDTPSRKSGWIDLSRVKVKVLPGAEWRQMFREAWRLQRDQFWTSDLSQVDWLAVYDRYLPLVERVCSRGEFSDLIWEMQGELGTSHAYELGGDYRPGPSYSLGNLVADFEWDEDQGGWRITHIVRGDAWEPRASSPLLAPGVNLEVGDLILAINGQALRQDFPPGAALLNLAGEEVSLQVKPVRQAASIAPLAADEHEANDTSQELEAGTGTAAPEITSKPQEKEPGRDDGEQPQPENAPVVEEPRTRNVTVMALKSDAPARYREWVEANRQTVHAATAGRVGYVHIPDMGPRGYSEFHRGFLAEVDREALIVDVRFNGGGHVSPLILEKLARRQIGYNLSRWGQRPFPYPPESVPGPIVALTNEYAGSDGDIFCHGFKMMKLGPLLGKRTWGGVVGIDPSQPLLDGSLTTQPEFAFWFADVGWQVENYGTNPDLVVDNLPQDYGRGVDAQLDRAIAEVLTLLEQHPPIRPDFSGKPAKTPPSLPVR